MYLFGMRFILYSQVFHLHFRLFAMLVDHMLYTKRSCFEKEDIDTGRQISSHNHLGW